MSWKNYPEIKPLEDGNYFVLYKIGETEMMALSFYSVEKDDWTSDKKRKIMPYLWKEQVESEE